MKQNAAEKAVATLNAQIAVLTQARNAITEAIDSQLDAPAEDGSVKPKRGRKRKGLPSEPGI